jgi:hypothetical protein
MNDITADHTVPPPIPSAFPPSTPLGEIPEDRLPITGPTSVIEAILRHPRRVLYQLRLPGAPRIIAGLFVVTACCALVYGVVVGTFSGGSQLWIAPAKIAGGMLVSALICLPSLYIFSCLSGSRARLVEVVGLVAGLLVLTTILLVGFAPVAWVFSQSTSSLPAMGALHLAFWVIATFFGWRFLRNGFAHLSAKSNGALHVWIFIFVLVCVQMTTALRPIIGRSDSFFPEGKRFFAAHWADVMRQAAEEERKQNPAALR